MSEHYNEKPCTECEGRGYIVRELPCHTMNSGGTDFYEFICSVCEGTGRVEVEELEVA